MVHAVLPEHERLLQVVAIGEAAPQQLVVGGVVVYGGMTEKRAGEPTDFPLQDGDRHVAARVPVVTAEL